MRYSARYEERGDRFTLNKWAVEGGRNLHLDGQIDDMPDWLATVINVAKLSGHYKRVKSQPPDAIVWFELTADNRLINFRKFTDEDND